MDFKPMRESQRAGPLPYFSPAQDTVLLYAVAGHQQHMGCQPFKYAAH